MKLDGGGGEAAGAVEKAAKLRKTVRRKRSTHRGAWTGKYCARGCAVSKPVIFFQGEEDTIVPPNQAEALVEALRRKGKAVGYFLFSGEQHGFRHAANIKRSLS
jgi:dienelactone hydrolase